MMQNRKTATKLLLVQWSRFQHVCIELEVPPCLPVLMEVVNQRFWML